ncbi:MAG: glutamate--tRNA ligase, partial [Gammaproteobacteria bacterium]
RPIAGPPLRDLRKRLETQDPWTPEALHALVEEIAAAHELKLGKIAQPLRVAVTGSAASPSIDVTLHLVGCEQCLKRLDKALAYIDARTAAA